MIIRFKWLQSLLTLWLIASSGQAPAKSCVGGVGVYREAAAVFSVIPMMGKISVHEDTAYFEVDVVRVWKGNVQAREQIAVALPRMLLLGDEYVLATSRDSNGRFAVTDCTPVKDAYRENEWIEANLGAAEFEYTPSLLQER